VRDSGHRPGRESALPAGRRRHDRESSKPHSRERGSWCSRADPGSGWPKCDGDAVKYIPPSPAAHCTRSSVEISLHPLSDYRSPWLRMDMAPSREPPGKSRLSQRTTSPGPPGFLTCGRFPDMWQVSRHAAGVMERAPSAPPPTLARGHRTEPRGEGAGKARCGAHKAPPPCPARSYLFTCPSPRRAASPPRSRRVDSWPCWPGLSLPRAGPWSPATTT